MTLRAFHRDKLKSLIHYIAYRCIDNPHVLGAVKLNKVLWYSDQWSYFTKGVPITGGKYIKKRLGPVSSDLMPIVQELEQEGAIAVRHIREQKEYLALTTPDMSGLSADDVRLVEDAIQYVCHKHTGNGISEKSHDIVWKLAELDEELPYHSMLAGRLHEVTRQDVDWALSELGVSR